MSDIPKILESGSGRYDLGFFTTLHSRLCKVTDSVTEESLPKLLLTKARCTHYKAVVEKLVDRNKETTTEEETPDMQSDYKERTRLLSVFFFMIDNGCRSNKEEILSAATYLKRSTAVYRDIREQSETKMTQTVDGLLVDMEKEKAAEAVEALSLTDPLNELEAVNDKIRIAQSIRANQREMQKKLENATELREQATDEFNEIAILVQAAALSKDGEDQELAISIINEFNAIIRDVKRTVNQSKAQKDAHKDKDQEEKPTDPEEPEGEEPEEPTDPEETTDPEEPEEPDGGEDGDDEEGGTHFEPVG